MRDLEEPLRQLALFDGSARAPALAVDDLFIGKNRIVDRVPVDLAGFAVSEAGLQQFQEQALLFAVIVLVAGRKFTAPVERQAKLLELGAHGVDILVRPACRVDIVLDGRILSRQAERIPAHGVEDIVTMRAAVAGNDVSHRIVAHMAHVQAP